MIDTNDLRLIFHVFGGAQTGPFQVSVTDVATYGSLMAKHKRQRNGLP